MSDELEFSKKSLALETALFKIKSSQEIVKLWEQNGKVTYPTDSVLKGYEKVEELLVDATAILNFLNRKEE